MVGEESPNRVKRSGVGGGGSGRIMSFTTRETKAVMIIFQAYSHFLHFYVFNIFCALTDGKLYYVLCCKCTCVHENYDGSVFNDFPLASLSI